MRLSEFRLFFNKRGLPGFSHFFSREKRAGGPLRDGAGRGSTPKYCYELDIRFFRDGREAELQFLEGIPRERGRGGAREKPSRFFSPSWSEGTEGRELKEGN